MGSSPSLGSCWQLKAAEGRGVFVLMGVVTGELLLSEFQGLALLFSVSSDMKSLTIYSSVMRKQANIYLILQLNTN